MSIPGLGQIAPTATPNAAPGTISTSTIPGGSGPASGPGTATETHALQALWEYRFSVAQGSTLTVRLASGTAERDGTELAPGTVYTIPGPVKSKINTWHGCVLEVSSSPGGNVEARVADPPDPDHCPLVAYLNLHFKLEGLRSAVAAAQKAPHTTTHAQPTMGPRVMVVGGSGAGKSTVVRTLTGWATRAGRQPLAVNLDPREGVLALPGTLSAAVFATLSDVAGAGWSVASTPMSRPSAVPPKLPIAHYYGLASPAENPRLYRAVCGALAAAATARLAEDPDVRAAGMLIDTPACPADNDDDGAFLDHLVHVAAEFSANVVVVLGSERVAAELGRRLGGQRTTLGEPVHVVGLERSTGGGRGEPIADRDAAFLQAVRERGIREYFFGDARNTLSPYTQQVEFDALSIWKVNSATTTKTETAAADEEEDDDELYDPSKDLDLSTPTTTTTTTTTTTQTGPDIEKVAPTQAMQNCTLAVVYGPTGGLAHSNTAAASAVRDANVAGFVYVADVDEKRRRLRVLAPVSARLGDRPLVWGPWPEPMVSLLG